MRLFRRGRDSRAPATVLSVETTDRLDQLCRVHVRPALSPAFESTLRTRLEIFPGAETFVLYDPSRTDECVLDEEWLRSSAVPSERAYTYVGATPRPRRGRVTLADARERLAELDRLAELKRVGVLTEAQVARERERILTKPA